MQSTSLPVSREFSSTSPEGIFRLAKVERKELEFGVQAGKRPSFTNYQMICSRSHSIFML